MSKNPRLIDLTGRQFGQWRVVEKAGNTTGGAALWLCICSCGSEGNVIGSDLRKGKSTNCGCASRNALGDATRTHGQTGTRLHRIWKGMRARCRREAHPQFEDYGGRGISICPEWDDFSAFAEWARSSGYRDALSIERRDVDRGYTPENCMWADAQAQNANRRFVSKAPDGELWLHKALRNGISRDAFYKRKRVGWAMEHAVTRPMR